MTASDVVVTGLGAITPLGGDVASTWAALLAGKSGFGTRRRACSRPSRCRSRSPRRWQSTRQAA